MIVNSVSIISGNATCMEIDITEEQYVNWIHTNEPVSRAFPKLNAEERDFLLTGVTPEEWDRHHEDEYYTQKAIEEAEYFLEMEI